MPAVAQDSRNVVIRREGAFARMGRTRKVKVSNRLSGSLDAVSRFLPPVSESQVLSMSVDTNGSTVQPRSHTT